ncbi:hypothetical protein FOA52_002260 [Chlamydomonas sp. UWO 241]|nr:hypothetical protein FOA52_002260 [Chlamydomonas sp. UWO 241]
MPTFTCFQILARRCSCPGTGAGEKAQLGPSSELAGPVGEGALRAPKAATLLCALSATAELPHVTTDGCIVGSMPLRSRRVAPRVQSLSWISQPLWGVHTPSVVAPISCSQPSKSTSLLPVPGEQTGSAPATKLNSHMSRPPRAGGAQLQHSSNSTAAAQQQQQQRQVHDRRRSCSAAESQIEVQIAGMCANLLAMASTSSVDSASPPTLSGNVRKSMRESMRASAMSASLLAQRAEVAARLGVKATEYRDDEGTDR